MTSYVTIPNTDVDAESPIDVDLMTALRDNPIAITEGASGAPKVLTPALEPYSLGGVYIPLEMYFTQSASFTEMITVQIAVPANATTMHYRFWCAQLTSGTGYFRLTGPATGTSTTTTSASAAWDEETDTIDLSTSSPSGGFVTFSVEGSSSVGASGTARFYGFTYYFS